MKMLRLRAAHAPRVLSVTYICGATELCTEPMPALVLREMTTFY